MKAGVVQGGSARAADFVFEVRNLVQDLVRERSLTVVGSSEGTAVGLLPGRYRVSERPAGGQPLPGYVATYDGDCDGFGVVSVRRSEMATCVVTNSYVGGN